MANMMQRVVIVSSSDVLFTVSLLQFSDELLGLSLWWYGGDSFGDFVIRLCHFSGDTFGGVVDGRAADLFWIRWWF
jgi:hypothetical protein